jgi:hypothetical protein
MGNDFIGRKLGGSVPLVTSGSVYKIPLQAQAFKGRPK